MARAAVFSAQAKAAAARARAGFRPPEALPVADWAERRRVLSAEGSALPGPFRWSVTPYLRGIADAYDDAQVREVVCQKSAQVGWTDGFVNNCIGYHMDVDPCAIVAMFPKEGAAKAFTREKLEPMIRASESLRSRVDLSSRSPSNTLDYKKFPGGFLKLVGSNSAASVKSTPARVAIVEEPDDCNANLKGQGDSIALIKERCKSFHNRKVIVGGTPTIKGISAVAAEMERSDKRRFYVPCHHCGHEQPLRWGQVQWLSDGASHPIYKTHQPETARYCCSECGALWTNTEKNRNVLQGQWLATAPFHGVAGFYLNELYSPFAESSMEQLVRKWLAAKHEMDAGDPESMVAFVNSSLGEPWELKGDTPELQVLSEKAEPYAHRTVPGNALVITAGVDVQHDRLEYTLYAWGRGEERWLLDAGRIEGSPMCAPTEGVWQELAGILWETAYRHESGADLFVESSSVDSSDGQTADFVYAFVRHWHRKGKLVMAIKGASTPGREIYTPPKQSVDVEQGGKAARYGLRPYLVGTDRAKDRILAALKLFGDGPGRLHWYEGVRADFLKQLTSEVKVPNRYGRKEYKLKAGQRNELLDCTVYAHHAARRLRLHNLTEREWQARQQRLLQPDLIAHQQKAAAKRRPAPLHRSEEFSL